MCDILIKNGTIIDGTGSKPYIGDIAITNGVIEQVGKPDRQKISQYVLKLVY